MILLVSFDLLMVFYYQNILFAHLSFEEDVAIDGQCSECAKVIHNGGGR